MARTWHAETRAQQRGIPPLIEQLLDLYGEECYGAGGVRQVYFTKKSIRRLEREFGAAPVRKLSEWLDAYKVENSSTGDVITVGHRYRRIRRK